MLIVNAGIRIPEQELGERFVRASGPGGQNVNKVATAVQLRFDVINSPSLPGDMRRRLLQLAGGRITDAGVLIIEAHRHRTRERNRQDARLRLLKLLRKAAVAPRPRKKTKPTRASKQSRLDNKRHRSEIKQTRRRIA